MRTGCLILLSLYVSAYLFAEPRQHRGPDRAPEVYDQEARLAADFSRAYRELLAFVDRKHCISLELRSSPGAYKNYKVTSLNHQGAVLVVRLEDFDDDDNFLAFSLRASDVLRICVIEEPF